jgi:hypothetical protein
MDDYRAGSSAKPTVILYRRGVRPVDGLRVLHRILRGNEKQQAAKLAAGHSCIHEAVGISTMRVW